jgi:hypothetical protein
MVDPWKPKKHSFIEHDGLYSLSHTNKKSVCCVKCGQAHVNHSPVLFLGYEQADRRFDSRQVKKKDAFFKISRLALGVTQLPRA